MSLGQRRNSEAGQASVELVGAIPFLLLVGVVCWQLVLTGHALWMAAQAARAGARADAVQRDPRVAARSVLPGYLERDLRVRRVGKGIDVRVRVPLVVPWHASPLRVSGHAALGGAS